MSSSSSSTSYRHSSRNEAGWRKSGNSLDGSVSNSSWNRTSSTTHYNLDGQEPVSRRRYRRQSPNDLSLQKELSDCDQCTVIKCKTAPITTTNPVVFELRSRLWADTMSEVNAQHNSKESRLIQSNPIALIPPWRNDIKDMTIFNGFIRLTGKTLAFRRRLWWESFHAVATLALKRQWKQIVLRQRLTCCIWNRKPEPFRGGSSSSAPSQVFYCCCCSFSSFGRYRCCYHCISNELNLYGCNCSLVSSSANVPITTKWKTSHWNRMAVTCNEMRHSKWKILKKSTNWLDWILIHRSVTSYVLVISTYRVRRLLKIREAATADREFMQCTFGQRYHHLYLHEFKKKRNSLFPPQKTD